MARADNLTSMVDSQKLDARAARVIACPKVVSRLGSASKLMFIITPGGEREALGQYVVVKPRQITGRAAQAELCSEQAGAGERFNDGIRWYPAWQFKGMVIHSTCKPATGVLAVTSCLYQPQEGGTPLWSETGTDLPDQKPEHA